MTMLRTIWLLLVALLLAVTGCAAYPSMGADSASRTEVAKEADGGLFASGDMPAPVQSPRYALHFQQQHKLRLS